MIVPMTWQPVFEYVDKSVGKQVCVCELSVNIVKWLVGKDIHTQQRIFDKCSRQEVTLQHINVVNYVIMDI